MPADDCCPKSTLGRTEGGYDGQKNFRFTKKSPDTEGAYGAAKAPTRKRKQAIRHKPGGVKYEI